MRRLSREISAVVCEFQFGRITELPKPGDVLHDAPDEQSAAHETKDPEHRLAGTGLQSLSEVGVPRIQPPPESDMAHEEPYGREDEDYVVEERPSASTHV